MLSTWFQRALEGGRISRVPLTALIIEWPLADARGSEILVRPLAYARGSEVLLNHDREGVDSSSRLVPVNPRGFHVTVGVQSKTFALLVGNRTLHFSRHA